MNHDAIILLKLKYDIIYGMYGIYTYYIVGNPARIIIENIRSVTLQYNSSLKFKTQTLLLRTILKIRIGIIYVVVVKYNQ